jgi:Fuc2NAc and GlcNAc transferase
VIGGVSAFLGAALASWLLTGAMRRYALRSELLDVPNERSLHRTPTPRGGGVAVALVTLGGLTTAGLLSKIPADVAWALGMGGALVAMVGWLDDRGGVSARVRATVHAAAACWAAYWIWGELTPTAVAGVVCIMWAINLYNFMDGIDGLAGAEAASVGSIAGALFLLSGRQDLAVVAFLMAAAATGFLGWNWPPARIFMGDVGSGFLGFMFGALSLMAGRSGALPLALCLLLAGVFAFDATVTLLRRAARGERWYQPHRSHAYQRLVQAGSTHAEVSGGVVLVNLGLGTLAWLAQSGRLPVAGSVLAGIVVLTVLYLAIERRRPMFSGVPGHANRS